MSSSIRSSTAACESFVVRVYRRDPRAPGRITGTVEVVASGQELGFTGLRELQAIFKQRPHSPTGHTPRRSTT
jgi:hypothetical protein